MFNLKFIIVSLVLAALVVGGVIEVKVRPAELINVPGRLLSLVQGEDLLEQGQGYLANLLASLKSEKDENKEEAVTEDKEGEVAGVKDDQDKKDNGKKAPTLTIPLKF